jgi:uncharacterized protein (DUF1697 family)
VALLRGINVAGHNRMAMADLRDLHEALGHRDVRTHIQSGNVIFDDDGDQVALGDAIEGAIRERFGLDIPVTLRSPAELRSIVAASPYRALAADDPLRVAIAFFKAAPDPALAGAVDPDTHHPDVFTLTGREIHLHCPNGFGRSKLNNAWLEKQLGVVSTIRNWKTIAALIDLSSDRSG